MGRACSAQRIWKNPEMHRVLVERPEGKKTLREAETQMEDEDRMKDEDEMEEDEEEDSAQ